MAPPNSRPPLTSRIRASFEGKRSKSEAQSPTHANGNGFITQDPESFRKAIDEAINSETFQIAIAANLAKLIKPSIKSALDTIQPVVEAVYNHEVLLRKTNRSVENILERMGSNLEAHAHQRDSVVEPHGPELGDAPAADAVDETKAPEEPEEKHTGPAEDKAPAIRERTVARSKPVANFEQFKQLLDESNARTAASLSELSSSIEASNGRITEVVQGISEIQAAVGPTKEGVDALKACSEQSATTAAVTQAQLDQLQTDIGCIIDTIGADLGKNVQAMHEKIAAQDTSLLSSHTTKLDAIATDLEALNGHSDTMEKLEAISAELTRLKGGVEAGITSNTEGFTSLGSQITNILTTIEGHTSTLVEIKDKGAHPEILAALQQSNDSHAAHAAALGEIKERSLGAVSGPASIHEGGIPETTTALQDLKADLASLKENIAAGLTSNNENVTGLGAKIDSVLTSVESHKAADSSPEILAALKQSNESHASHAAALEEVKSLSSGPAPAAYLGNLAAWEAQVGSIIAVLDAHTSALDEIKAASSSHTAALEGVKSLGSATAPAENAALESQIGALAATLDSHTSTLDEIKSTSGLHSSSLDEIKTASTSHAIALEEVKSLGSASAPAENNLSSLESRIAALTATLDAHTSALDEIKSTGGLHSVALDEIKTTNTSHAIALENARSLGAEPAPAPAPESNNLSAVEAQISAIIATLATHTSTLDELKSTSGSHNAAVISALETHASALGEIKGATTSHATALEQVRSLADAPPFKDKSNLSALEAQVATIVATLEAHTAILDHIKTGGSTTSTAIVPSGNPEVLEGQFNTIIEILDAHTNLLNELKDDVSAEILTTLHELGQSQAQHRDMLTEIREADVSDEILTLLHASGESHATAGTTLDQVHSNVQALNELHAVHTIALDEIKSRSVQSAPTTEGRSSAALEAKIDGIASTLESHHATLSSIQESHASHTEVLNEIRDATAICNESHADHALALSEIKEISSASNEAHSSHIAALADIKQAATASNEAHASHTATLAELQAIQPRSVPAAPGSESPDLAALETNIKTIITTLENQTATLSSIKESTLDPSVLDTVKASHELLNSHTSLLETIKDNSAHEDILSNISALKSLIEESESGIDEHSTLVRGLHSETKETHSSLTSAIAGLALGGAAGAGAGALVSHESEDNSAEILNEVKSVKEKIGFVMSQIDINNTTVTTSIATLSDELKAEVDATGTQITESITIMDANIKALDLDPITSAVQQCGQVVKDLSAQIDSLEGHAQANGSKIHDLHEGVHLNDKGISQLREHAISREIISDPVPEAMWFGSGSGSPSAKRLSNPFESGQVEEAAEEDEGPVLEAIPEVDTPLEESPVKDLFEPTTICEEQSDPVELEISPADVNEEAPAELVPEIVQEPEEIRKVAHEPTPAFVESELEPEPEITKESRDIHAESQPEHLEETREQVPEPQNAEPEVTEEPTREALPAAHEQEMVEESIPVSHEEKIVEEAAPIPHTDEHEHIQEDVMNAPVGPEVHHEPELEPESIEELREPSINSETAQEMPEAEHVLQHQDQEPEPETIEEPTETIPEPESAHEIPETELLVEHHAAPDPARIHKAEKLDEAVTSPASIPQEHAPAVFQANAPLAPSQEPEESEHQASLGPEPSPSTKTNPFSDPENEEEDDLESASASTSAIASPLSGSFSENTEGAEGSKGGKKGKKGKKDKSGGKKKKEKVPFVMDGEEAE